MTTLTAISVALLVLLVLTPFVILRPRKRPPEYPPPVDRIEANYAAAHGYTPQQWADLTPNQRRDLRNSVAYAPYRKDAA